MPDTTHKVVEERETERDKERERATADQETFTRRDISPIRHHDL